MSKLQTLGKALRLSLQVKGVGSFLISLLGFAAAFLPLLCARQLSRLTDALQALVGGNAQVAQAMQAFALLAVFYIVQTVFESLQGYCDALDTLRIRRAIKRDLLKIQCEVRYRFIENDEDFQKRIAFAEEFGGQRMAGSIQQMIRLLQQGVSVVAVGVALYQVSPWIVLALLVTSIPAALLSFRQNEESFRHRAKWMEAGALAIHYYHMVAGETFSSQQEIRHLSLFDYLKARWRAIADEHIYEKNKIMKKHVLHNTAADFLRSVVYIAVLLITAFQIYQSPWLGLGLFTLVYTLSGQMQTLTGECLVNLMVMVQDIPYMQEYFALEALEKEPAGEGEDRTNGEIVFDQVSFAYPGAAQNALEGISVTIAEGEKVAIVGENGSGKSTFITLLCGMFTPQSGKIYLGGRPVDQDIPGARRAISLVFQDFAHYEDTLRANITISDKDRQADDAQIEQLLYDIHAQDVLQAMPQGLCTQIGTFGEKARDLSGGQWQKVSIARAAYRQGAQVMILDEPTAALDPIAEAQLYRSFATLTGEKTTLLISHRLGITSLVDRILVFHQGRIVEDGSHTSLMEQNGHYARMYRAQAQWYEA